MSSATSRSKLLVGGMIAFLVIASLASSFIVVHAQKALAAGTDGFNHHPNVLISDQFNNRVIEVNRQKQIVWQFGTGDPSDCSPGPGHIIAPNDAERLGDGLTLIPGTGTSSCPDNRVIVVNDHGQIVWQYGKAGVAGSGSGLLNVPVFAIQLPNHDILIVDQANNRVIEVNKQKKIVWSYGPTKGPGALNNPNSAELLANGHILIADENNSRVIEIDHAGHIVWQFSQGLNIVAFASRLPNGNTLIVDSGNNRVISVTPDGKMVFQYFTNKGKNSNANPNPTGAVRLSDGELCVADQFNDRIFVLNTNMQIEFQYGMTNVVGNGPNQLNAPYSAVVIGDYTGVTPPPEHF
jgi:hypothetical protein